METKKKRSRRKTGKRTKERNAGPKKSTSSRNVGPSIPRHTIIQNSKRGAKMEKENARIAKKERRGAIAKKVVDIYSHDLDYRFLYEGVLYFFAVFLKTDMQHLNYRLTRKINLAAKWCPSTDSSFDRSTMLNESIAKKVIPGSKRHVMLIVFAIN